MAWGMVDRVGGPVRLRAIARGRSSNPFGDLLDHRVVVAAVALVACECLETVLLVAGRKRSLIQLSLGDRKIFQK